MVFIELMQLRYFVTVAQLQHLTRAAEQLRISQPALSKAISRLEKELGTELFDRSANRISLNSSGRLTYNMSLRRFLCWTAAKPPCNVRQAWCPGTSAL